jgi:hypothetical protein
VVIVDSLIGVDVSGKSMMRIPLAILDNRAIYPDRINKYACTEVGDEV